SLSRHAVRAALQCATVATKKLSRTKTKTNGNGGAHSRMREGSQEAALVLPTGGTRGPRGYRPPHVPPVEAVGLEERAASLAKRSIKKASKKQGLELAIAMMDLTTLEGKDT